MGNQHKLLFKNYSEGKASEKEKKVVDTYFSKMQDHGISVDDLKSEIIGERIMFQIQNRLERRKKKYLYSIMASVAAIVLFASFFFNFNPIFKKNNFITVVAKFGEQKKVVLPDASTVYLNSGSSIVYPEHFGEDSRNISLKGEAYFQVTHNKKLPFIISSKHFKTQVLGTQFIVSNYEKEIPSVTVVSGKVKVTDQGSSNSAIITKNQRITYNAHLGTLIKLDSIDASNYLAWKDGKLFFDHANIEQVLLKLQRKYNVVLKLNTPLYDCHTISGNFSGNNIEKILNSIRFINDMDYSANKNDTILIKLKPCKN